MGWFLAYYYDDLPEDAGFRLFGAGHLAFLLAITIGTGIVCVAYRRVEPRSQSAIRRVLAAICLALELGKDLLLIATLPSYPIEQLPLHMCGMGVFILVADAFAPGRRKTLREIMYSLSLPGAVAALLFPDWTPYPILNVYSLQGFLGHGVLICYVLTLLVSHQLIPDWRGLWRVALFGFVVSYPVYVLNRRLGTNFLFINGGSPGSPLAWLESRMGNPGYLIGYAALILLVWLAMYAPFIINAYRAKRRSAIKPKV